MDIKILVDALGWVGSLEVIVAYFLISYQKIDSKSLYYQVLNLSGAGLLVINTIYYGAYPSTFINIVWMGIAIAALIKFIKS